MDIEYIKKVLKVASDDAYEGYKRASVNSKQEIAFMCAHIMCIELIEAINRVEKPKGK